MSALAGRDDETLRRELADSNAALESRLGAVAPCFAYPFGLYDDRGVLQSERRWNLVVPN